MAEILFTHSYFLRFDPKEFRAMTPYPPLGTLYAASAARDRGYTVALFDSMLAQEEREIAYAISRHHPRIVVIYDDDFNYLSKMCLTRMRHAAFLMAEIAHAAGCTVIVHGSDPVDHIEDYFAHHAEYVLCGEGEETLLETLDHLLCGLGERPTISGLAYLHDREVHRGSPRTVLQDLDRLVFPAWDLVDMRLYRTTWKRCHGYFSLNMVTTRGCPFHCNWCAKPLYGQGYNSRSPENVVTEMLYLKEHYAPDRLWFCDDVFGLTPGWIQAFAEEVQRRHASVPFKCQARVDLLLKGDTIDQLRRSGCASVWVGAESGSQTILDAMEKGTTVGQIYEATRRMKRAGIRVGFFLQFGYPGETAEDIEKTLAMVRNLLPDEIGISVSYPLPGTPFYDRVKGEMGEKRNWEVSEDLEVMFRGTFEPEFYRLLHKFTHKKLRIWQGRELLGRLRRRPWTIRPAHARLLAASTYHATTIRRLESDLTRLVARREREDPAEGQHDG
jgi:anaerobic magnesium-protoporphyrin IX monomethyl ester cyclase